MPDKKKTSPASKTSQGRKTTTNKTKQQSTAAKKSTKSAPKTTKRDTPQAQKSAAKPKAPKGKTKQPASKSKGKTQKTKASQPSTLQRIWVVLQDPQALQKLRERLPSWSDEVGAFGLIILGVLTLASLFNPSGEIAEPLATGLQQVFGIGSYLVALILVALGILLLLPKAGIIIIFS
ncbi:MAG: hypothetical protein GYB66_08070, partial [Chloroflexi bacterium]|nr:hypothetical protein [Chloroflexota bacterium]